MRPIQMFGLTAGLVALAACSNSESVGPELERHYATLTAASSSVTTSATGSAEFTVNGSNITYTVSVANIDSVTAAHIHVTSNPSTVLADLFSGPATGAAYSGNLKGADVALTPRTGVTVDSVLKLIRIPGATYVNIHTTRFRGGELRGDIIQR